MTSTPMTNLAGPGRPQPIVTPTAWVWIGVCTALFVWMHWLFLKSTYYFSQDPDWSHVVIVPVISVYYIVQHRARLAAAPKRLFWWALPLVFFGLYAYVWGIYPGRNDMMRGYSMILTVFFTVLFLLGPSAMRVLWFPIAYLVFAVKVSDAIWSRVAERLQDIAAAGATVLLELCSRFMDFGVQATGNTIVMTFVKDGRYVEYPMNVAEACAGLRMLMAFIALGVALAFLFDRSWWQRVIMIGLTVPIALAVNIGRVTALGLIATVNSDYAVGDFHLFVGMLMLVPAAALFLLVGWVLDQIIIKDESAADEDGAADPRAAGAGSEPSADRAAVAGLPRLVALGVLLGGGAALLSGVVYAMTFNVFAGQPVIGSVPRPASAVLMAAGVAGLVAMFWGARRIAAGRTAAAGMTFGAAIVAGLLATAAAGQHSVLSWQELVLHKEQVPLRHKFLTTMPLDKGTYRFVRDDVLAPEIVDELGTEDYLSRWYEDTRFAPNEPGRMVRLHVAYYTGLVDTVPHVPDRCFVAGGVRHKGLYSQVIALDPYTFTDNPEGPGVEATADIAPPGEAPFGPGTRVKLPGRDIETVRFTYGPPDRDNADQHVSYFFAANGKFLASPNEVRLEGFDIRDRYSYYCKIEVQIVGEADPQRVAERTTDLLNTFLPEILACLPDWGDVKAGRWPTPSDTESAGDQP
ncbi:MAG: exosortase/archaeosortase family protein [Planctomycetota bacterium]